MANDEGIRIIVGLGNPGRKYSRTRHNMGFMTLDALASRLDNPVIRKKTLDYHRMDYLFGSTELITIKPLRYMNLSGEALLKCNINWDKAAASLLVVYDDADLEFGRIRIRESGSAGGHKGLKNIIDALGTQSISRLRIGIGDSKEPSLADHVLSGFDREELELLPEVLERSADAISMIVEAGIKAAMNEYNKKNQTEEIGD